MGRVVVPTNQVLTPAGRLLTFPGRPTDLAMLDDQRTVVVKNLNSLIVLDAETGTIFQTLTVPSGGHAVAGLAVADGGATIYSSGTNGNIFIAHRDHAKDPYRWSGVWTLLSPRVGGDAAPTGLALTMDGKSLLVLSGRGNTLWCLDRNNGKAIDKPIDVGVAPFGVVVVSESKAYVTNWGGEPPRDDEPQALSSNTRVRVNPKTGAADSGSVSVVDLKAGKTVKAIATGLHSSGVALSKDRRFVYVACANSDTIGVINTETDELVETITVRPEARLPFGSGPNALAPSADGGTLYVANGTNNAVAVVELGPKASAHPRSHGPSRTEGFIPVGWYPGAIAVRTTRVATAGAVEINRDQLIVANIKGQGSRHPKFEQGHGFNSHDYLGSISILLALRQSG